MAIKQFDLYSSASNEQALKDALRAKEAYDAQPKPEISDPQAVGCGDPSNHLEHVLWRQKMIQEQERDLSALISDGWRIISSTGMSYGMSGAHLILYKTDEPPYRPRNKSDGLAYGSFLYGDLPDLPDDYDPLVPGSGVKGL